MMILDHYIYWKIVLLLIIEGRLFDYTTKYLYLLKEKIEILNYLKQFYADIQTNGYNIKKV